MIDKKDIIGRAALITVKGMRNIPAKVDTGADSSCIWASDILETNGLLRFNLFGHLSSYFTGEYIILESAEYKRTRVASSTGQRQARYAVLLPTTIAGHTFIVRYSLANRESMVYPILLGRDVLSRQFLVDVNQSIPEHIEASLRSEKRQRIRALRKVQGQ